MKKAKVFQSGNSQAVRIPKEFHLEGQEVEIIRKGHDIILREIPKDLTAAFEILTGFSDDFFAGGRQDMPPQNREFFQ
jgi:antitoxin VapB